MLQSRSYNVFSGRAEPKLRGAALGPTHGFAENSSTKNPEHIRSLPCTILRWSTESSDFRLTVILGLG